MCSMGKFVGPLGPVGVELPRTWVWFCGGCLFSRRRIWSDFSLLMWGQLFGLFLRFEAHSSAERKRWLKLTSKIVWTNWPLLVLKVESTNRKEMTVLTVQCLACRTAEQPGFPLPSGITKPPIFSVIRGFRTAIIWCARAVINRTPDFVICTRWNLLFPLK